MFSPEVHYLVQKEQYKDLQREIARQQLIRVVRSRRPDNWNSLRRMAGWTGTQMVKWGSKLQQYATALSRNDELTRTTQPGNSLN